MILNRARGGEEDETVQAWCRERDLPLLLSIPDRRSIAEAYARGIPLVGALPELENLLAGLYEPLQRRVAEAKKGAAA